MESKWKALGQLHTFLDTTQIKGARMVGGGIYEGQSGLGHLPNWSTLEDEGWDTPRLPRLEPLSEPFLQSKLEMDTSVSWESTFKHDVLVIFV